MQQARVPSVSDVTGATQLLMMAIHGTLRTSTPFTQRIIVTDVRDHFSLGRMLGWNQRRLRRRVLQPTYSRLPEWPLTCGNSLASRFWLVRFSPGSTFALLPGRAHYEM